MTDEKEEWTVRVDARTSAEDIGPVDLVIVLVKSFATREAVAQLKETNVIGENTLVMSLQNGLGNEEAIAEIIGEKNVISGKTYVGGRLIEPGYVSAGVKGKDTYIGELTGEITERIQKVADEFNRAGLHCEVSGNIRGLIWDKLLINVAAGALCGITRLPYATAVRGSVYQGNSSCRDSGRNRCGESRRREVKIRRSGISVVRCKRGTSGTLRLPFSRAWR